MLPRRSNAKFWLHMMAAVLAAFVVTTTSCLFVEAKLPYKIALEGATYTIKSNLITPLGGMRLEEFHSSQQRRSRINYRTSYCLSLPGIYLYREGNFIADDHEAFYVNEDRCTNVGHAAIGKAFQIDMLGSEDINSNYVIGAARLLMDIELKSDKFEPAELGGKPSADTYVATFDRYEVTVYYKGGHVLALGVPSAIYIFDTKSQNRITLRTKLVTSLTQPNEIIVTDSGVPGVKQPSDGANELLIDMFASDRARGCTKIGSSLLNNERRFSFKANLLSKEMRPGQLAVGFEPDLATLRADHSYETKRTQTITNFRQDRSYNLVRRVSGGGGGGGGGEGLQPRADYFDARYANDVACVVTQAGMAADLGGRGGRNAHPLDLLLYGASRAAYLGRARVRGMDAHVYEAYDSSLPVWLDVPSVYESQKGTQELRASKLPDEPDEKRKLTTVLYFNGPLSQEQSKLLLIEIFSAKNKNLYTIPIYEFSWDLRPAAPNGERWEDFYSLGDACLAPSTGDNHYARLTMQLKLTKSDNPNEANEARSLWLV